MNHAHVRCLPYCLALGMLVVASCSDAKSGSPAAPVDAGADTGEPLPPPENGLDASTTRTYAIVDTNQTGCYASGTGASKTCSGTGYDGDYTRNAPSYTKNAAGTVVTDNVTGLMWMQSADLDGNGAVNSSDKRTKANAVAYCESLSLGGYDDWRLPDVKTLYSLIQFSGKDASSNSACSTAGSTSCDTSALTPFIDSTFQYAFGDTASGERVIDGQFATTTEYVSTTMSGDATMFGVNFVDGRIKGYPITKPNGNANSFYVKCVRGETTYGVNNFKDNGNKTISDSATGLMWQKEDAASTGYEDAISTCENLSLVNKTDWRLPSVKELQSIVDYTRSPDTTSSASINAVFTATSITNEAGKTDYAYYWASTTHLDYDGKGKYGAYVSFGRALGYMNSSMYDVHGAGAQRSNYKLDVSTTPGVASKDLGFGTFYYHGPQGDILRANNRVRCVRTIQ